MEWVEALNTTDAPELPPREEMIEAISKMLPDAPYVTKKAIALYIYEAGYQFQDGARGCMIGAKKLSDTSIMHMYTTLLDAIKTVVNIEDITLE